MDKPKCKLCGDKHWSREACSVAGRLDDGAESAPSVSRVRVPTAPPPLSADAKFDKVAYQRDYMRKRRAAAKEALK